MADAGQEQELLFFDTFSHENAEELNLDLVQFPRPVIIYEVRVIPLQTRVQADVPGGVRLGATNPSAFKLELFVNNLNKPNAATFEKLGALDYKENVEIQMKSDGEIPTDGLILKGWYNTLTVAIYGTLTVVKPEQVSPPPPPPPNRAKQVVDNKISQVSDTQTRTEWEPPKHPAKPQQQHPLDYINQQVQLQQKKQQDAHALGSHPQTGAPPPGGQQAPPNVAIPPPGQHRDILQDFMSSPKMGHHDREGQFSEGREQFDTNQGFRAPRDSNSREREYERSRESSREKEYREKEYRDSRDEERKRREKEWEKFRERERERSRERERDRSREKERDSRDWPQSPSRRRSWSSRSRSPSHSRSRSSRSRSRSRSYSKSPVRSMSRSPRRPMRSLSRSPRRSYSRSPRRSRSPIRSRSRTPVRSRTPIRSRSFSRSPDRRSLSPPPPVAQPVPVLETPLSPGPPPPTAPVPREMSPIQQITVIQRFTRDPSPPRMMREHSPTQEEIMEAGEIIDEIGESELFDPLSPEVGGYTDDAEQEVDDTYENISSDEELTVMDEGVDDLQDFEELDESWSFPLPVFNPFSVELTPIKTFPDLSKTEYEVEVQTIHNSMGGEGCVPEEAKTLLDLVNDLREAPHEDRWVTSLEGVPRLLTKGLAWILHKDKNSDVLDTLLDWAIEGIDEEKAKVQPQSAFKVRHLKMGIRLVGCLCCCDTDITKRLMERNVQQRLLDLFASPCMSFSLRLQIIRALDQSTRLTHGMDYFIQQRGTKEGGAKTEEETGYQRLLALMTKKYNVRVAASLAVFVRKVHIYEVMTSTKDMIKRITEVVEKSEEEKSKSTPASPEKHPDEADSVADGNMEGHMIKDEDAEALIANLLEIIKVFTISPYLIGQPRRALPSKSVFEIMNPPFDPRPDLFCMANSCGLVESIFLLLTSPVTSTHPLLFGTVREFIQTLLQTSEGLVYLSSHTDTVNGIMKCLLQVPEEGRDEAVDESPTQQLGLEMVFSLQTLQYLDKLAAHHKMEGVEKEEDEPNVMTVIHELYTMTLNPVGRPFVIKVLSMEDNLDPILKFAEKTGDETKDSKRKKSACVAYSMGLVLLVIRHSTQIDIYRKFGERLVTLSEEDFSSKLLEMQEWLQPVKAASDLSHEGVGKVVTQLKQYTEDLHKIPRGLITTMRILRDLSVPPVRKYPDDTPEELKYKYTLLELYGADTFPLCTNILQKVSEILLRPWQRGLPQSSEQIAYHLAIIKPTLQIVKDTLCYLIAARGTEFKDLTALPVLFEVYTVLCSVPISSYHDEDLLEIQLNILDTLMAYTQPIPDQSETEEALSQSLWTKTLKELLKYTIKAPYTYLSGLLLLSELLPVPLPLQTKEPLNENEITIVLNTRKLWSVHLHSLGTQIQEMINILATSTCQPLQQVLRRVCWQLSDLSAPTATMITRCILDLVVESFGTLMRPALERKEDSEAGEDRVERVSSPYASKMLNLLAFVLAQPSIKCAALQLMMQTGELKEEKYGELMSQMLEILNTACETVPHIQAQECIVSILQSICDPEVALVMGENVSVSDQIAYALPNGDYMTRITTSLLDHMGSADHSYASILPCVRTLVMLTEHDYGFYYLKTVLEQKTTAIGRLMVRINTTFSKDSSDCLSTLSTLLEFLRLLKVVDLGPDGGVTRSFTLSQQELQEVLSWNPNMENHPLLDLEKLLEESAKEEETLESLLESMTGLMKMLRDPTQVKQEKSALTEPTLPTLESLSTLYNMRSVYSISDMDDERLNPDYWLSNPATDVADIEPDLIMFNMDDLCRKYCPEFNLEEELKKTVSTSQAELTKPRRVKIGDRRKSQEISIYRGKGFRKPFVAPMRGRGIARGMMGASSRMDSFRTRAPNTSRPPSMHVDDFMKLEKGQSEQDDRSSGQQVSAIRRVDSIVQNRDNRGRGFDRGRGRFFQNRGRFFSPQGNYGRREPSNNIYVGGGGSTSSGGTSSGYNRPKSTFDSQQSFGHGYQSSGDRRLGQRDFRFSPAGGYYSKDPGGRFMGDDFHGRRDSNTDRGRHARSFTK